MRKEKLGYHGLRAHVVDLAHVYQEALGEDLNNDVVGPVDMKRISI